MLGFTSVAGSVIAGADTSIVVIVIAPPASGIAPLTLQVLDQPYNNSLLVDGVLNDRSVIKSGLESVLPDVAIVNTLIVDKPIPHINQALLAIIPQL